LLGLNPYPKRITGVRGKLKAPTTTADAINESLVGIEWLQFNRPYVYSGVAMDINQAGFARIPYTQSQQEGGRNRRREYAGLEFLRRDKFYLFQVTSLSRGVWHPSWCDGSTCKVFKVRGNIIDWNIGTTELPRYAISGARSFPYKSPFGISESRDNQFFSSGRWQPYCWTTGLANVGTDATRALNISPCNAANHSGKITYRQIFPRSTLLAQTSPIKFKPLKRRSLVNATQAPIDQYGQDLIHAYARYIISGIPKVAVAKLMTRTQDYYDIGLGKQIKERKVKDPFTPHLIFIITGNLNDPLGGGGDPVGYIIFGVHQKAGFVESIEVGGGYSKDIRKALKDPSFPDDYLPQKKQKMFPRGRFFTPEDVNQL
jgi:hypothetical protein